jgi:hypothetical protein
MRSLTMVLVSAAAMLVPALASADPGQVAAPDATATAAAPVSPSEAAPAAPAQTATAQAPAAPVGSQASNPDEVVCRMSAPTTGSRLGGGRECHTQRAWDARQQESQRALVSAQKTGLIGKP